MRIWITLVLASMCLSLAGFVAAQEPAVKPALDREALFRLFEQKLSGVKLVGHFTVLGKEDAAPRKEEYTIQSVKKLPEGDYWLFTSRIKYGDKDVTVPLPIEVKWAGETPMISLTDFTIPSLGTFSARVVFHESKYAGTWTHGEVGGHLFGVIEKLPEQDSPRKGTTE